MGRKKKKFVTADNLDRYIAESFLDGISEVAFSPNKDIFNLEIKRRKKESKTDFRKRQNRRIKKFVEKYLYIVKDGMNIPIKLIAKQVILIADVFYRRKRNGKLANKIIIWASRGGGKGVTVSVILFLMMVYKNRSAVDLGGSKDQALIVYEYTRDFLSECIPIVRDKLLDGDPLISRTKLKSGAQLKCIANSATQTRGKHPNTLICDEASIVPGTLLWTENGPKEIEKIKKGEKVLGNNGKWQIVKKRMKHKYDGRILNIRSCGNGLPIWVTEEHRIFGLVDIGKISEKSYRRKFVDKRDDLENCDWYRAWDYKVGDILSYPRFKRIDNNCSKILQRDDMWRFLGYWCGDGSAPKTKTNNYPIKIYLGKDKSFFVNDVVNLLKKITKRSVRIEESPSRPNSIDIVVSSHKKLWNLLRNKVGMLDKRGIPLEWMFSAKNRQLKEFLIGIFRTDGGPHFRPDGILSTWSWAGTSSRLAMNVMYCLNRLGIPAYINKISRDRYGIKTKDSWNVIIKWKYIKRILENNDFVDVDFPQKDYNSKQWCDNNEFKSLIYEIEEDEYNGYVYDLQMEGDPSFGTPGRVMLHNCQEDARKDKNVESAINMVFSEKDFLIMLLSTFHVPIGLFQEYWDEADKRGFVKYKWDIFDTTERCTLPKHCFFCNGKDEDCDVCKGKGKVDCKECPLTQKNEEYDLEGNLIGFSYDGCNGKCLKTNGYSSIVNLFAAHKQNTPETWQTEFMCKRPRTKGPVYDLEAVFDCFVDHSEILLPDYETISSVGIDWGWSGQTSIIGPCVECAGYIGIVEEWYKQKPTMDEIINYLRGLIGKYGQFVIFPDSSHPFMNASLVEAGFGVWYDKNRSDTASGVVFSKWKEWGIDNLRKYWDKRKLKISYDNCPELWEYLKIYKVGPDGKPVKFMDHGPDALLTAMLAHPFVEEVLKSRTIKEHSEKRKASQKPVLKFGGRGDEKTRQSI